MEVVINISEDTYNRIRSGEYTTNPELGFAIQDGTVLPKEHGDLIDRSELLCHTKCTYRYDCPKSGSACDKCGDNCIEVFDVMKSPTVIKADIGE